METNLIQAPELLQRLRKALGIRQAHITPSLNSGVQAVVILDDVSEARTASKRIAIASGFVLGGVGVAPAFRLIANDTRTRIEIIRVLAFSDAANTRIRVGINTAASGGALQNELLVNACYTDNRGGVVNSPTIGASLAAGQILLANLTGQFSLNPRGDQWEPKGLYIRGPVNLYVGNEVVGAASALGVAIEWREVVDDQTELT